jgi:hypothetical protein
MIESVFIRGCTAEEWYVDVCLAMVYFILYFRVFIFAIYEFILSVKFNLKFLYSYGLEEKPISLR